MKVIVDAMGGDNAPLEIIKGCAAAVQSQDVDILLVGDEQVIRKLAQEQGISLARVEILHASEVITMEEDPSTAVRRKPDSSMAVGLKALAGGEGDVYKRQALHRERRELCERIFQKDLLDLAREEFSHSLDSL